MIALACRITLSLIISAATTSTAFQARPRLLLGSSCRIPLILCQQQRITVVAKKSPLPLFLAAANNEQEKEQAVPQSVQVCKSKDCRRRGGAQRLLGQIQAVRYFRSVPFWPIMFLPPPNIRFFSTRDAFASPREQIAKEEQLDIPIIESCDCLGECGYGPNILIDNAILINNVRNQEDIRQALGLPPAVAVAKQEEAETVSPSA
jgi:hypothetical protein